MTIATVKIVRIYISEGTKLLDGISRYLQKKAKIRGFSVFRAIKGYGTTGSQSASLLDLSLDLPLVIEFFDTPKKVNAAIKYLSTRIPPGHIVSWNAKTDL
jgi:PII-like signaling protein